MARIEIKVDGEDVAADKVLKLATLMLKILKSIEKEQRKEKGERSRKTLIRWRVDILSGFSYALIAIRAEPSEGQKQDAIHQETSQTIMREALRRTPVEASSQPPGSADGC